MKVIATRLSAIRADITTLEVDAIVNAANSALMPGGGVDGAIRRAAGPEITRETERIGACPTGKAVITGGYDLPAPHVIHTAAPVYGGGDDQDAMLASCYASALDLARTLKISVVAFPALGTGIYGWPPDKAAPIAVGAVVEHLSHHYMPSRVIFCCFSEEDRARYRHLIAALG